MGIMITLVLMLIIMFVYLDFSFWYRSEMHNIWHPENQKKFRGALYKLWDYLNEVKRND